MISCYGFKPLSVAVQTLDALPRHLLTPFNGPVPPSNLLDKIARSVSHAQGPLEWPHSVRATRAKLVEIARARDKGRSKENMTIDEQDEDEVVEMPGRQPANVKRPLYRQSSMDFLPSKDKGSGSLSRSAARYLISISANSSAPRLSSRLQRTDRIIPTYHPYARPTSRSPSPPVLTPHSERDRQGYFPLTPIFAPSLPPCTLRRRTSSNSLGSRLPQPLRRSSSTMSTHSNPTPTSTLAGPTNTGVLPSTKSATNARPTRRSDSFSCAALGPPSLKRAPSFGACSIASGVSAHVTEKQVQDPESDEEEKARDKKVKRPRTRSATAAAPVSPDKKRHEREKKTKAQKDPEIRKPSSPTKALTKSKSRTRAGSMFGAELPQPQSQPILPTASRSSMAAPLRHTSASPPPTVGTGAGSPPKTLRRIKTTTFNLGPCAPARRISFGSLAPPMEEQEGAKNVSPSALGSAFQMS